MMAGYQDRPRVRRAWRWITAASVAGSLYLGLGGSWLAIVPAYFAASGVYTLHRIGFTAEE